MSYQGTLLAIGEMTAPDRRTCIAPPGNAATITLFDNYANWSALPLYEFGRLVLNIDSSHDSGASGVVFSSSSDGRNYSTVKSYTYATADGLTTYDVPVNAPYVRIAYTNSANVLTRWRMSLKGVHCRAIA